LHTGIHNQRKKVTKEHLSPLVSLERKEFSQYVKKKLCDYRRHF